MIFNASLTEYKPDVNFPVVEEHLIRELFSSIPVSYLRQLVTIETLENPISKEYLARIELPDPDEIPIEKRIYLAKGNRYKEYGSNIIKTAPYYDPVKKAYYYIRDEEGG